MAVGAGTKSERLGELGLELDVLGVAVVVVVVVAVLVLDWHGHAQDVGHAATTLLQLKLFIIIEL